jgi:hypothetical protein
MYVEE